MRCLPHGLRLRTIGAGLLVLAALPLTARAAPAAPAAAEPVILAPGERVRVQGAFVLLDGGRRLYACLVGTPAGVHYAYDFETGTPFLAWRGAFADMSRMWVGAGHDQVAQPAAPAVALGARPAFAFLPGRMFTLPESWPDAPAPLYRSLGYELERDGQPVFLATLEALAIRDRIGPAPDGAGLERRLEFSGRLSPWETWLLLGEAGAFTATDAGWSADGGRWWIAWPAEGSRPLVRTSGGRAQLALRLEAAHLAQPLRYTVGWK